MKGHDFAQTGCRKCGKIHIHPRGTLGKYWKLSGTALENNRRGGRSRGGVKRPPHISQMMRLNNPMFNPRTVNKMLRTRQIRGVYERYSERMKIDNPMFTPKIKEANLKRMRNNNPRRFMKCPSRPQVRIFNYIRRHFIDAELEYPIKTPRGTRFLDIAIPSMMLNIEYDGVYWHKNKRSDEERDDVLSLLGWSIIRIRKW